MAFLLLLAALVSGSAALAAEVVWFRALGRGLGTSAEALAVVSASFLGGLGLGAAIAGRAAERTRRAVRVAALCEAAAGTLVFLSPWALAWIPDAHLALLGLLGLEPGPSAWPAALVALPVLVAPTVFLGATLPLLVRARLRDGSRAGRWTGALYGMNTLGAAIGTALAVVWLLPALGETAALRAAGAGNLLAAILLLLAERPEGTKGASVPLAAPAPTVAATSSPAWLGPRAVGVALFVSGIVALGGEVAWFRLLEPMTGVHVYGFALLLAAVLLGTAIGGAVGGFVADRARRPDLCLAAAVGLGGALAIASVAGAGAVPWFALRTATRAAAAHATEPGYDPTTWIAVGKALGAALVVAAPLMALAAAYPLAVRVRASSAPSAARAAGAVYAWNTAGNVVGSLAVGFVLLPALGGPVALTTLGALGLVCAATLWLRARRPRPLAPMALFVLPLAALCVPGALAAVADAGPRLPEVVAVTRWTKLYRVRSREDLRYFADVVAGAPPRPALRPDLPPIEPREGRTSTVGLLADASGYVRLRQGGLSESRFDPARPDAGTETEVALGVLPVLLHPDPHTALVVGHGAGWTAETVIDAGLERVDVAEIEETVLDVVETYRGAPLAVRTSANAHLRVTDGRLLLRQAAAQGGAYDVVVSQPSHPWVPGAGHLFTTEAYALSRAALRKGGVFAQWLNAFGMTRSLFRTALASFLSAFPDAWLFVFREEVVLLGFTEAPRLDTKRFEAALRDGPLARRAAGAGILGAGDLWRRFVADGPTLAGQLEDPPRPATDDDPRLELGCAWNRFVGVSADTDRIMRDLRNLYPPDLARAIPDAAVRHRWTAEAIERHFDAGAEEEGQRFLDRANLPPTASALRARARGLLAAAAAARPGTPGPAAAALRRRAEDVLLEADRLEPDDPRAVQRLLDLYLAERRVDDAAATGAAAAARFPRDGKILAAWARGAVSSGDRATAREAFRRALATGEAPRGTGADLARLHLSEVPPQRAEAREVLAADPESRTSRAALVQWKELEIYLSPSGTGEERTVPEMLAALDAADAKAAMRRARTHADDGKRPPESALASAREATRLSPDDAEAWFLRAWLELSADDAHALDSLARAERASPDAAEGARRAHAYLRIFGRSEVAAPAVEDER